MAGAASAAAGPPAAAARPLPKVLVLTGPTAVGKTKASLELAERLNGEIISADSVQVYRGLDIGSDKIPVAERRGVRHHLLDVLDPHEEFSAGHFFEAARAAAQDILQAEAAAAAALEEARAAAREAAGGRELSQEERWAVGVALVRGRLRDPGAAARLEGEPNNWYRLQRVVDILLQSGGRTLAELDADPSAAPAYDCRCFFLHRPRLQLFRRIDTRVEEMVAGGLLREAGMLLAAGLEPNGGCAARAIGYRQAMHFLQRCREELDVEAAEVAREQAAVAQQQGQQQQEGEQQREQHHEQRRQEQGSRQEQRSAEEDDSPGPGAGNDGGAERKRRRGGGGGSGDGSGGGPPARALSEEGVIALVKDVATASRQYCTRQMTWFRDDAQFKWVDATRGDEAVVADILAAWDAPAHAGGCGDSGRLSREQERELRQYVPHLRLFAPGSPAVRAALEEARRVAAGL
eukprot:scaffold5.g641.t1